MRRFKYLIFSSIFALLGLFILYKLNFISHKKYSNEYFDISTYISAVQVEGVQIDVGDIAPNEAGFITKNGVPATEQITVSSAL